MSDSEDEVQDWGVLGLNPKSIEEAGSVLKRGEKDHAPDGTMAQQDTLAASRQAMYTALAAPRGHVARSILIGEWCADLQLARVVQTRGNYLNSMGSADSSGTHWLLPEEVIYLVQRGSMLCYYGDKPLSVQGAIALCLPAMNGPDKYLVYSHLKKLGYVVRRPPSQVTVNDEPPKRLHGKQQPTFFNWFLQSILNRPQLAWRSSYCSYASLYRDLQVIRDPLISSHEEEVCDFYAWRPATKFKKSQPGEPEFRIKVLDGHKDIPPLDDIHALLGGSPAVNSTKRSVLARMREGRRSAVLAVVDSGVVAFIRVGEPDVESLVYR